MRVTDQLALVGVLLAASSEGNPLTQTFDPKTFTFTQVGRPVFAHEYRGRYAVNRVLRKYANGNAPPAPPMDQVQKPLKKAKVAKSKAKAPAGAGETTAHSEGGDQEYVCEVQVGSQKVRLNFDTGSSDLWVYSTLQPKHQQKGHNVYDPKKSYTSKPLQGGTWTIGYGDGSSAGGDVHTDHVSVGQVTAKDQAVELAKNVSNSFMSDFSNDGLLGLGFPKGTEPGAGNTISVNGKSQPQNTFFSNVRPRLPLPLFTADLKNKAPGSYDFGFIDKTKYTGDIKYFDADSSGAYWGIKSQRYGVKNGQTINKEIKTIIDTGTTLMLMPQDVLDFYYKQIPNSRNDKELGGYVFPCSQQIPDFTIGFGAAPNDFTATIPSKYMNFGPAVTSDPTTCFGAMQFMAASDSLNAIYGDIFLKAVFTVFEAKTDDKPRLGFAMKPEATTTSPTTPTSTPSASPVATCTPSSNGSGVSIFQSVFNSIQSWFSGKQNSNTCPAPTTSSPDNSDGNDSGDSNSDAPSSTDGGDDSSDSADSDGEEVKKEDLKKEKPSKKKSEKEESEKEEPEKEGSENEEPEKEESEDGDQREDNEEKKEAKKPKKEESKDEGEDDEKPKKDGKKSEKSDDESEEKPANDEEPEGEEGEDSEE